MKKIHLTIQRWREARIKKRQEREKNDRLAEFMRIALSTQEGAYMVNNALRYGLSQQNAQESSETGIPEGMNPEDEDQPPTQAELKAWGLDKAPLITKRLPDGRVIVYRKLPLNVTLQKMEA